MACEQYDYLAKVVFIGDSGVGKSELLKHTTDLYPVAKFSEEHNLTIGVEFSTKIIKVNGKKIKLQTWDTAGKDTFRTITRTYYRGAHVVCLMWDAGVPDVAIKLKPWFEEAQRQAVDGAQFVFVRTKIDLDNGDGKERQPISRDEVEKQQDEIRKFAGEEAIFVETSAKTGAGVQAFLTKAAEVGYEVLTSQNIENSNLGDDVNWNRAAPAPEIPGRLERMSHSRTVRETHLNQDGLDKDWLKLHLLSVEQNCRTAETIRGKLDGDLEPVDAEKYAPVLELLRELDSDERAFKYKFCIFFTFESYSTRIVAERNQQVRQVILDVAYRLFNMAKNGNWERVVPSAEDLYGNLNREQVPEKVREILEDYYPNLRQPQMTSLTG